MVGGVEFVEESAATGPAVFDPVGRFFFSFEDAQKCQCGDVDVPVGAVLCGVGGIGKLYFVALPVGEDEGG